MAGSIQLDKKSTVFSQFHNFMFVFSFNSNFLSSHQWEVVPFSDLMCYWLIHVSVLRGPQQMLFPFSSAVIKELAFSSIRATLLLLLVVISSAWTWLPCDLNTSTREESWV